MTGDASNESDLAEDIVGVEEYEAPAPSKKEFLAWHKPRKQFIRAEQWCEQIKRLLDDSAGLTLDAGILKYCGLPGTDLLDLRCFHEAICVPRSLKLRFLGFNSAAAPRSDQQIELNISLDEVIKLGNVDPISEVIQDDIRAIANTNSIAWTKLLKFGPFDVVNLDLCDSLGADEVGLFNENYYNAIAQLMAVQARQKTPWLLLLTTRVGNEHVHGETLKVFQEKYARNLNQCEEFKKESLQAFEIGDEKALAKGIGTAIGLQRVFLTGICKWLLGIALGHQSSLEVKSVLGYRVDKSAPITDIVSIAVRFTPHAVPADDPLQLSQMKSSLPDECVLSVKALKRVAKLVDVDGIMTSDAKIKDDMTVEMAQLLETARYDSSAYMDWVASDP